MTRCICYTYVMFKDVGTTNICTFVVLKNRKYNFKKYFKIMNIKVIGK